MSTIGIVAVTWAGVLGVLVLVLAVSGRRHRGGASVARTPEPPERRRVPAGRRDGLPDRRGRLPDRRDQPVERRAGRPDRRMGLPDRRTPVF